MIVNNLPRVTQTVKSAKDIVILYVKSLPCNTKVEGKNDFDSDYVDMQVNDNLIQFFSDRKDVQYISHCYTSDEMPFPHPASKIYFFFPGAETPTASLDPEFALHNFVAFFYHTESIWTNKPIGDILRERGINSDEDLDRYRIRPFEEPSAPHSMASVGSMASNLLKTTKDVVIAGIRTGEVFVSDQIAEERISYCNSCEFFKQSRCTKCGCFMASKSKLKSVSCPIGKW
jgi:hypothetical protein